jgi:hypothetical protein
MKRRFAAALVAMALAGCGSDAPPAATPQAATPTAGSAVEGTWATQPFGRDAIAGTLTAAGLNEHVQRFFTIDETPNDLVITLRLAAGQWTAYRAAGSVAASVNDRGTYTVEGGMLLYRPNAGGLNTYRWSITGDRLSLTFVSTTEPPYEGLPNDVFQRAFYTTVPFTRAPQ